MPKYCKEVTVDSVIEFFSNEIDGIGKKDGHLRNEDIPDSLKHYKHWEFCKLTEDEFMRLEIPDRTKTLIRDKTMNTIGGFVKSNIKERIQQLKNGRDLDPIIIRELLPNNNKAASFYIEDGAKRAIAYKFYFEHNPYKPVRAYIGKKCF